MSLWGLLSLWGPMSLWGLWGLDSTDSMTQRTQRTQLTQPTQRTRAVSYPLTSVQKVELLKGWTAVLPPRSPGSGLVGVYNPEAVIPPQCYTRTEGHFNPCYVCHQDHIPGRENRMKDARLQQAYSFSEAGQTNRWRNLFEDRTKQAAAMSDEAIRAWINDDNFSELTDRLEAVHFRGYIPRLQNLSDGVAAFDEEGFAKDGSHWVAFNYKPFPSTFWPTNGSTDDVMIRLPAQFRQTQDGAYSREVYKANLAILEAAIKGFDSIGSLPIDETQLGQDLNGDGTLGRIHALTRPARYVGAGSDTRVEPHVYPHRTEFLHTVRYVGVDADESITNARRMKEVRYMRKRDFLSPTVLAHYYDQEYQEKLEGILPHYPDRGHAGLYNKMGWLLQGFIEDKDGRLRFNTYEETMFCMGCHNTVGSSIDKTYSFPRKIDGAAGWGYINLRGMPDAPTMNEQQGEILTYLERVGGGTEFRNNPEMAARWYHADGSVNYAAVAAARDVYELITPSPARALLLNKAYKLIVEDQDFIYGRDATLRPPANVYEYVDNTTAPTLPPDKIYTWDIRLNWAAGSAEATE